MHAVGIAFGRHRYVARAAQAINHVAGCGVYLPQLAPTIEGHVVVSRLIVVDGVGV